MGRPAAKKGDQIIGLDIHIVMVPTPVGTIPVPQPSPFRGDIKTAVSPNVYINKKPAATLLSGAKNQPPHIPIGGSFMRPPTNRSMVILGSTSVSINFKPAARAGDLCLDCNDPVDLPTGSVVVKGKSNVFIGG